MPGVNSSLLKDFIIDPKLFYLSKVAKIIPQPPEERYFVIGRAIHSMILEPENFDNDFIVGESRQNTKAGIANKVLADKENKALINEEEKGMVDYFAQKLPEQLEWAQNLGTALNVYTEITVAINVNGVELKARADRVIEYKDFIDVDDIKTSSKKDYAGFLSNIVDYDYLLQYSFYRYVLEQHFNKPIRNFNFVFCSKEWPRNICFIAIDDQNYYDLGFAVIKRGLANYYQAQATGIWYQEQEQRQQLVLKPYQLQKYYNYLERNQNV